MAMETQTLIFSLLFLFISFMLLFGRKKRTKLNLPPSPANWLPVLGHLRLLKLPICRTFLSISESLGGAPVFSLHLGNRLLFVVSSLSVAEECFTKNDVVLANRPKSIFGKYIGYNYTSMMATSYGEHWRNLRRIGNAEIFSSERLNSFLYIRKDEIQRLIVRLSNNSLRGFAKVEMKSILYDLTFNNIIRMLTGKLYSGDSTEDFKEAKYATELLAEVASTGGAGNVVDYIPMLRWINDYEKRVKNLAGRIDSFLQGLIDMNRTENRKRNNTIDHLLSLQESEPEYYSDCVIKGILLVLVLGGTDTSAATIEWALSNLLNHPEILKKVKAEIDDKVGLDRLMDESDISNLPYLQNILSETLRLYPPAPMLLPHMSSKDCTLAGYDMPRGTTLVVNVWAIHRDPKLWEDPLSFKPERFEKEGEARKLLPFGLGRRACPGAGMAQRVVALALGSLIQCYEWERVDEKEVDMTEGKGNTMPKAIPLEAMCKARTIVAKILDGSIYG